MLDTMRASAGSFAAKILLAFLVLSFAIWGVGDMVRHPGRNMAVAKVGGHKISVEAFQHELQKQSEKLKSALGGKYSPEMLKSIGLPQQVLQGLVNDELLRLESQSLGLVPGDADVVRMIRSDPAFQDNKGNFDKRLFEARLQHSSQSEKAYVENLRENMAATLIIESLTSTLPVPDNAAAALHAAREEQRTIALYALGASAIGGAPQPDSAQIDEYYNAHSREFSAPETRVLSYVSFRADDVQMKAVTSDEDLHKAYEERIEEFKKPEQRHVEQLLYANEQQAKKAYDMLKGGAEFGKVAKETEILNKGAVSLGAVERGHIVEAAEDHVFGLKEGEITEPIQSPFGWHIFHVNKIVQPKVASFEEARPLLEKELRQDTLDSALNKFTNALEDALAGGATLQEAAGNLGLKVTTTGPIDREGKNPDGGPGKNVPDFDKFLETAFKTDEKTESSLVSSKGGTYYIVRADSVTPERIRPLDEVRTQVVTGWQKEERAKRLADLARTIGTKFADESARAGIIGQYKLQQVATVSIKRSNKAAGDLTLPLSLVQEVFERQPGQATGAHGTVNGDYLIAVVKNIAPASVTENAAATKAINTELSRSAENELLEQYMDYLADKYSVSVNEDAVKAVLD